MSTEGGPVTAPDRPGTPDGRTYSAPETAGQATYEAVPEVYRRWLRIDQPKNWNGPSDGLIRELWAEKSDEQKEFWRSLDAAQAAAAPAPAGEAAYPDVSGGGVPYVPDDKLCAAPGHIVGSWCVMAYDEPHQHQDEQGRKWGTDPHEPQAALDLARAETATVKAAGANTARDLAEVTAERDRLQGACQTLGMVVERMARDLYAMWIDVSLGDLEAVRERVLNSIPDCDDNEPDEQWNGTETGAQWLERTRETTS